MQRYPNPVSIVILGFLTLYFTFVTYFSLNSRQEIKKYQSLDCFTYFPLEGTMSSFIFEPSLKGAVS